MADTDDKADAAYHARVVVALLGEVLPGAELQQVRDQLPRDEEWDELFELIENEQTV